MHIFSLKHLEMILGDFSPPERVYFWFWQTETLAIFSLHSIRDCTTLSLGFSTDEALLFLIHPSCLGIALPTSIWRPWCLSGSIYIYWPEELSGTNYSVKKASYRTWKDSHQNVTTGFEHFRQFSYFLLCAFLIPLKFFTITMYCIVTTVSRAITINPICAFSFPN